MDSAWVPAFLFFFFFMSIVPDNDVVDPSGASFSVATLWGERELA